jgi:hypothetical protein
MPVDILFSHRDTIPRIKAATKIHFFSQSSDFIKEKQSYYRAGQALRAHYRAGQALRAHYRAGQALRVCRSLRLSGFKKIGT